MFSVSQEHHPNYGDIILIERDENGSHPTPQLAYNAAITLRRLFTEKSNSLIKFVVDNQVLSLSQLSKWCKEEYQLLPKCFECGVLLLDQVHISRDNDQHLFCSDTCVNVFLYQEIEKTMDEEEIDYL